MSNHKPSLLKIAPIFLRSQKSNRLEVLRLVLALADLSKDRFLDRLARNPIINALQQAIKGIHISDGYKNQSKNPAKGAVLTNGTGVS